MTNEQQSWHAKHNVAEGGHSTPRSEQGACVRVSHTHGKDRRVVAGESRLDDGLGCRLKYAPLVRVHVIRLIKCKSMRGVGPNGRCRRHERIVALAQTLPMMAARRMIFVRDLGLLPADDDAPVSEPASRMRRVRERVSTSAMPITF